MKALMILAATLGLLCIPGCDDGALSRNEALSVLKGNKNTLGKSDGKVHTLLNNYLVAKSPRNKKLISELGFNLTGPGSEQDRERFYLFVLGNFPRIEAIEEMNEFYLLFPVPRKSAPRLAEEIDFEVTGIHMKTEKAAEVHFGWSRQRAPDFWKILIELKGELVVNMVLFDDGWRLDRVVLAESEPAPLTPERKALLAYHVEHVLPCALSLNMKKDWAKVVIPNGWKSGERAGVNLDGSEYCE